MKNVSKESSKILDNYEAWSKQVIHKEKSVMFMSSQINSTRIRELSRIIGFSIGWFPVTYLRAPIRPTKSNARMLMPLVQKICNKVTSWKWKLMSKGGRLILIYHDISFMAILTLTVLLVSKMVIKKIIIFWLQFCGERVKEKFIENGDHGWNCVN